MFIFQNQLFYIWCCALVSLFLSWNCAFAADEDSSRYLRGIPPHEYHFYQPPEFRCRDGSKTIPIAWVNDDYCDCKDGTDEPGTSACWNGRFYCANVGHIPQIVPSSRVNDGLCDCCDGSDEWLNGVSLQRERGATGSVPTATALQLPATAACTNRCLEEHQQFVIQYINALRDAEDGWHTRAQWIATYEAQLIHSQGRIQQLQNELDTLNSKIQRLEEAERELTREHDGVHERIKERLLASELEKEHDQKHDGNEHADMIEETAEAERDAEESGHGAVESASGEEVAGTPSDEHIRRDAVESQSSVDTPTPSSRPIATSSPSTSPPPLSPAQLRRHRPVHSPYTNRPESASSPLAPSENVSEPTDKSNDTEKKKREEEEKRIRERDERIKQLVDQHPDITRLQEEYTAFGPTLLSLLLNPLRTLYDLLRNLFVQIVRVPRSEKSKLEESLRAAREARDKVKNELDELKTFVTLDLGPRGEFYGLYKTSLTFETKEYTYELLPFDKVLQKSKGTTAHSTNLGRWEGWEAGYTVMKFGSGDHCWNGPHRSVRIEVSCGRENQILEVKEPSKCTYTMRLRTPAKCDDEYLNKLRAPLRT